MPITIISEAVPAPYFNLTEREVKQPGLKNRDRLLLVFQASKVRAWPQALLLIKPATLLGWHRDLFRLVWKRKSATDGANRGCQLKRLP